MKKVLDFKKGSGNDVAERISYGTIAEILGDKGTMSLRRRNLSRTDRRVSVTLKKGGVEKIYSCTQSVSDMVRAGEIKLRQLLDFELVEFVTNNQSSTPGEERIMVSFPNDLAGTEIIIKANTERDPFKMEDIEDYQEVSYLE